MKLLSTERLYKKIRNLNIDLHDYIAFQHEEEYKCDWHGISVQQKLVNDYELSKRDMPLKELSLLVPNPPHKEIIIDNFLKLMKSFITNYVSDDSSWIVLHDNNRNRWLSDLTEESAIKANIIQLFRKENIDMEYRGAFYLTTSLLIDVLSDLISFPYYNKSEDINLINEGSDYIIRFTHHFSVDFMSTRMEEIEKFQSDAKRLNLFEVKAYK